MRLLEALRLTLHLCIVAVAFNHVLVETDSPGRIALAKETAKNSSADKLSPVNEKLLVEGKRLYDSNRYWGALSNLEKILETDKENPEVYLYLGHCYMKTRKTGDAAKAYEQYLELNPDAADADKYRTLIDVLKAQSKTQPKSPAQASTITGDYMKESTALGLFRWPESRIPITVFIEPGDAVPGYRAEFDDVLRHAFREWETATEGKVKFDVVSQRDGARMIVTWTDDMHAPELRAEAGKASVVQDSEGIKSADIQLLTVSPFKEGPLGCELLYNVCLHEIGHALGLMGHSPYPDDIMYPQLSVQTGITPRDAKTLHVVYAAAQEALTMSSSGDASSSGQSENEFSRLSPKNQAQLLLRAGTKAVFAGEYKDSIAKLEAALKIDPTIELARSNLAVSANNLALQTADKDERLILLHKALFWTPTMDAARVNLEQTIDDFDVVVKDPASRIKFADKLEKQGDLIGACVELSESLKLKSNPAVQARVDELTKKILAERSY